MLILHLLMNIYFFKEQNNANVSFLCLFNGFLVFLNVYFIYDTYYGKDIKDSQPQQWANKIK